VVALNYAILDVAGQSVVIAGKSRRWPEHPQEMCSTGENVSRAKIAHADSRGVRYKG
jgi:hypothetical protein